MAEDDKLTPLVVRKDPTGSTKIVIEVTDDSPKPIEVHHRHGPTVIRRWEAILSISMFAATSAVQWEIIPTSKTKYAMWFVSIIAQVGIIFGRPLLVRGAKQEIQMEKE